jgi:hypothetical protein
MAKTCYWNNNDAITVVHNKQAIQAALFLMFFVYTVAVFVSEIKRSTDVSVLSLLPHRWASHSSAM